MPHLQTTSTLKSGSLILGVIRKSCVRGDKELNNMVLFILVLVILVSTGIGDFLKNSFLSWTGVYFVLFDALVFILGAVFSKNH